MLKSFSVITIFICVANSVFASEKCGKNEKPTPCFEAVCERRTCSDLDKPIRCVRIDPKFCTKGCLCKDTYLRADNGTCIPADQCSCDTQCGDNEVYDICPPEYPGDECNADTTINTCLSNPEPGDPECKPGCRCIDNYKRNECGYCIPKEQCLQCGGKNEVNGCKSCPPQTCESIGNIYNCPLQPLVCQPECRCKNGYYRNKIGDCISKEDCLKCTGPNEFFSCGGACDNVCATLSEQNQTSCPIINIKCNEMCYCEEGYARDSNNICVPISQCPQIKCSGKNEVSGCYLPCPPQTCESLTGIALPCIPPPINCQPECRCKDGYYRNKIGECISKDECLKCTGPNEYFACGGACDNVCATLSEQNQTNCPIINIKCNEMCYCEEGYARDSNNICVPISKCPKPTCGINEIYDRCPATCPPKTCDALTRVYRCKPPPQYGHPDCKPGCRCADNYYRNKKGICVPKNQCPKPPGVICGPDEVYTSCVNGGCGRWNCSQPGIICIDPIKGGCREGCRCKEGLLRADDGTCIPADKCPLKCYGQNEVSGCQTTCPPDTCESIGKIFNCPLQTLQCKPECRCQNGYYRNKIGECISKEDCLKCTGTNEYFACGGACDNVCATLSEQNQTNCPIINIKCNEMCYCEEGYARDSNNICVPISKCPKPTCGMNEIYDRCPATCPPKTCDALTRVYRCKPPPQYGHLDCKPGCRCADNYYRNKKGICVPKNQCPKPPGVICGSDEVYTSCVNGGCGRWTCSQPGIICIDPIKGGCREGCRCKEGLLRADNGTCIPADKCPLKCYGQNEVSGCKRTCPPETCESIGLHIFCPRQPVECEPQCRCKDGYYRNKIGECILKEDCLKCTEPHEYFSCGGACDNVCTTLSEQNQTHCPIVNKKCNKRCYCEKGYARNCNDTCVPISKCPNLHCSGQNEITGCYTICPPQTCDSIGKLYSCPAQPVGTVPECRCKKGYYRNKIGDCISEEDCLESMVCGINETYDLCPATCPGETCESIEQAKIKLCPVPPKLGDPHCQPRCRCFNNHYRNKQGICVPKDQCPKPPGVICGSDEVYTDCVNGGCGRWKCSQPGIICIDLIEGACIEGCHCKDGLLRADNGSCIPADQCPLNCYGQNEVSGCKRTCPPDTCESIGKIYHCPLQPANCEPECRCKNGYFRNKIGDCISKEDCLKCTGPNEYFACDGACDNVCATLNQQNQTNCPIETFVCNEMCYCDEGYARDSNNICVPISQCPEPTCGPNEIYDLCPATCPPKTCDGLKIAPLIDCKAPPKYGDPDCEPGCTCIDNYYRNKEGICVPKNECLKCYGQNEVSGCKQTCPPDTCESIGKIYHCPLQPANCEPECRCKNGYFRNKIGDCISKEECLKCTGPNEYFACDGACDNVCAILNQQNQTNCPIATFVCNKMCYCDEGYARDSNNICVPISECPEHYDISATCGVNEIYDLCPATCPPKTCDGLKIAPLIRCKAPPKYGDPDCKPGCTCIDNYYRNKEGICVPKNECPKPPGVVCGSDEVYTSCVNGGCGRWNCSQSGKICIKLAEGACREGCHCKEGLLRADDGRCIPADQCPLNCHGINEVSGCHTVCPPQTCESIGKVYPCPLQLGGCKPECRCKENYYRNKLGVCISKEDCLKCTGPHEYFACGGACDNVCTTLSEQNQTHCPIVNIMCNRRCYCEKGYARDCNNTCVPISECPNLNCCGQNEVTGCHTICPPQTCESIGKNYFCPARPVGTAPECRCKKGYYRNKAGDCISEAECEKCTGPNEYFSTDGTCDEYCETSSEEDDPECSTDVVICSNMCRCEEGYARDSNNNCVPTSECQKSDNNGLEEFEKGNIAFTGSFLKIIANKNPGKSIIFSALGVLLLLAQLTLYAFGPASVQLLHLLNLSDKNQIRSFVPNYLETLTSQPNVTLDLAERMYISDKYELLESVLRDTKNIFDAEAQSLDFCQQVEAAKIINDWVLNNTNNLIPNLVSPNMLDCNTVLVMVNAIYFKGDWVNKFDPKRTIKQEFYVNKDKTVTVNMMRQTKSFKYTETKTAQIILLPYKGGKIALMVLLPKIKYGLYDMIDEIANGSLSITKIINQTNYARVDLSLPKIHTTTTTDLIPVMKENNVTTIFNPYNSGLNVTKNGQNVYVSSIVQKAFIDVDEVGTEAAAATAVVIGARSVGLKPSTQFIANHPFVYYIIRNVTPIFCGIYYGDTK